jgi:hypothetical protein
MICNVIRNVIRNVKFLSTILKLSSMIALFSFGSIASAQSGASDPSGTWRWKYDLNGTSREDALSLFVEDGKVTGVFQGASEKSVNIKDAKLKDDQVSCTVEYTHEQQTISLAFSGKIKKDDLEGTVAVSTDGGTEEYPWTPKRSVRLEDAVGEWKIVIDADGNRLTPSILITKSGDKLQGKYTVAEGIVVDATNLRIRENNLEFHMETTIEGRTIKADYSGRPYGNVIKGTIQYDLDGNEGEIEFSAQRQPTKK